MSVLIDFLEEVFCLLSPLLQVNFSADVMRALDELPLHIRPSVRENLLSPMSYARNPSRLDPSLALPSRRATGNASPLAGAVDGKKVSNEGTLYLFDPTGPITGPEQTPRAIVRRYHNDESELTREWPKTGIRHVDPVSHEDRHKGLRVMRQQQPQQAAVIGSILNAAPGGNATPRTTIRCAAYDRPCTMGKVLNRYDALDAACVAERPLDVGTRKVSHTDLSVNTLEKLIMSVADHVQRRNGGAASFFVALCRGLVAPHAIGQDGNPRVQTASRQIPNASTLWLEPPKNVLTLRSCRDQLAALTGISVSLQQLAAVFWSMEGSEIDEDTLGRLEVSYQVFAAAFTDVPSTQRLFAFKI